jgi:hypothetical protein
MSDERDDAPVVMRLSHPEALVLFEFLARAEEAGGSEEYRIEDEAERHVLWRLEGRLERTLWEPLAPNYDELLETARAAMRNPPPLDRDE